MGTELPNGTAEKVIEQVRDWRTPECEVDRSRRVVRNVALAGLASRNGYRYSEQALVAAAPLYENKPVFLDHAAAPGRPQERSTRDLVGTIVNPRFADGRLRGDVQALDTEAGNTFLALSEGNLPAVGMSHVVLVERTADGAVVEKIRDVVSVDAVMFPATTTTFREQTSWGTLPACPESAATPQRAEQAIAGSTSAGNGHVPADNRDPAHGHAGSVPHGDHGSLPHVRELETQLALVTAERDALRRMVEADHVAQRLTEERARVAELLREAQLPGYAVTPAFRQQLIDASDSARRRELVAERAALIRQCLQQRPTSRERSVGGAGELDDAAIVRAVRGKG